MINQHVEKLSAQHQERFTEVVAAFEADWERHLEDGAPPPRIEERLPAEGPLRPALVIELALIDLERRLKAGQGVRVEQYLEQFAELRDGRVALDLIQVEYEFRALREPGLKPAEYAQRFPQLAAQLEGLLAKTPAGKATHRGVVARDTVHDPRRTAPGQQALDSSAGAAPPPLWYYARGKQKCGPFSWTELQHLAARGQVTASDPVFQEGTLKWRTAGSVPGLFAANGRDQVQSAGWPLVAGYEIETELGRGGMGVVYQACQVKLKRLVALKMILAGAHAGPEQLARFRTEAEAVARLQHPNIVQIHEVGEQDGLPYFSLEFVDGGSLAQKLGGKPLSPPEAVRLVEVLARTMQAAHERGIVHRDLKPANVLLTKDGIPKITDFGLAKRLDVPAGQTQSGELMGTPSYMAPEQALGEVRNIGPATDVYALGAILYECLTGRPPFVADTAMNTVYQVVTQEAVPPSRLQPGVPRDLQTICLKCLQKEPDKRYADAAAVADDLRRFLKGEPIRARPVSRAERLWRWCRREPRVAGLTAAAALLLVLVAAVTTIGYVQTRAALGREAEQRQQADRQRSLAEKNEKQAHGAVNFFTDVYENELSGNPDLQQLRKKMREESLKYYQQFLEQRENDPALQAQVALAYFHVASILEGADPQRKLNYAQKAVRLQEDLRRTHPNPTLVEVRLRASYNLLAGLQLSVGKKDESLASYQEALVIAEKLHRQDPAEPAYRHALAMSHHNLGYWHGQHGENEKALASYQAAGKVREALVQTHPDNREYQGLYADTLTNVGIAQRKLKQWSEAEASFKQAAAVMRQVCQEEPNSRRYRHLLSRSYSSLVGARVLLGRKADAAATYVDAARELARCIPLIGGDRKELAPAEQAERWICAHEALAMLGAAVRTGYRDGESLKKDPSFVPLRSLDGWQKLRVELEKQGK